MMKRILFTIAMLWSIAYGQSKVYIRGDSIVIQKIGGNGELIIENGTRNVTGGVLTNMGNGRTRFVLPSGGGSSDSSFNSATFGANIRQVGERWNRNMQSGTLNMTDVTPNATVTTDATGVRLVGGNGTMADYLETPDSVGYFSFHNYIMTLDVVGVDFSNSSMFSIGLIPGGNGQGLNIFFKLHDSTGYMQSTFANTTPIAADPSTLGKYTFQRSDGDTLRLVLQRMDYRYTAYVVNLRNKSYMQLDLPEVQTTASKLRFNIQGGDFKIIGRWNVTVQDVYSPYFMDFGGSLTVSLTGASQGSRGPIQAYRGVSGGIVDMSGATEQIIDEIRKVTEAATFGGIPTVVSLDNMVNAFGGSVHLDTVSAWVTRWCNLMVLWDVPYVYARTGNPQGAGDIRPYNDTLKAVFARFRVLYPSKGFEVFDKYPLMVADAGTGMNVIYDYGDGIHESQAGIDKWSNGYRYFLADRGHITESSPITTPYLPVTYRRFNDYDVVRLPNGDWAQAISGTSPGYIWLKPDALTNASRAQVGNAYIDTMWTAEVVAGTNKHLGRGGASAGLDGSGVYGNDVYAYQSLLVGASTNRFQIGTTRIDFVGKPLEFSTSAPFNFSSIPMIVTKTIPQNGGNHTFIVKASTDGGGVVNNAHKIASFLVDTDTLAFVAYNGAIKTRAASGYTHNIHGTLSNYDFPTIAFGDSAWGGGGGGAAANANIGSGYRILLPGTQEIKTLFAGANITIDSTSNTDGLTIIASAGATGWGLTGNAGTTAGTNYVGTSDNNAFDFRTNATQAMRLNTSQELMIGSTTDAGTQKLQITGDQYILGQIYSLTDDISFPALRLRNTSGTDVWRVGHQGVTGTGNLDFLVYNGQGSVGMPFIIDFQSGNALFAANSGATVTPREAVDINGSLSVRTVNAGTSIDSVGIMEDGRFKSMAFSAMLTASNITSGTYTPTLTNGANVTGSTAHALQYLRVGSTVTVSGMVEINVTAGGPLNTELEMSLPVASNFAASNNAGGAGASESNAEGVGIYADAADDRVRFNWAPAASGNRIIRFSFTYQVL